jgi:2-polyprenyl-6-methoxyphenol hydroxylase-like FAD-dependent oxidoreductase
VRVETERLGKQSMGVVIAHTEWVVEKSLEAEYEFVIGADGYGSIVRQSLDASWDEIGPPESWAVFETVSQDVGTSAAGVADARLRVMFGYDTCSMLWNLPENRWQWAFQIHEEEARSERPKSRLGFDQNRAEARQRLLALVSDRAPEFFDAHVILVWSARASFERRVAAQMGAGRCWLVGDAAHISTPLDVHSLDLALVEAKEVADQVADVLDGKTSLLVLDTLGHARQSRWERLVELERGLVPGLRAAPWVARYRQQVARILPARNAQLVLLADQLGLEMPPVISESIAPWPTA